MEVSIVEKSISQKEMLPEVINRIFKICKTDPNFKLKDEMKVVEEKVELIESKILRQENLLVQSSSLLENVNNRIKLIKEEINSKQIELLEQLGNEL